MKKAELFCRRKLNSSDNIIDISPDNHLMLVPEIKKLLLRIIPLSPDLLICCNNNQAQFKDKEQLNESCVGGIMMIPRI